MTDAAEPELPRGVALAWGIAANPQRGPKREMSVERIVEAAVEIADADGLGAVSMAAVAARLGFTPMSLYRYVTAKDDLILLMQEEATGLPPEGIQEKEGWRARMAMIYDAQVQIYLRHPWMLDVPITGSPTTPNSSAWMDAGLAALEGTPLGADERLAVTLLVSGQVRWYGTILAAYARTSRDTGLEPDEITRREAWLYETLITADEYPALHRVVQEGAFLSEADPFHFGLERSLDGVAAYIAGVAETGHEPARGWTMLDGADIADDKRHREAAKAVRDAEKALRDARKLERQTAREARERLARQRGGAQ